MSNPLNSDTAVLEKQKAITKPQRPPLFKVMLLNDDFTPMEFVVDVLLDVFKKTEEEAVALTLIIHSDGKGVCGVFVKDIAELRRDQVLKAAQQEQHPLRCVIEPETPQPGRGMKP